LNGNMSELIYEKAQDLGRLLGQTPEHQALERARARLSEDRESVTLLNRLVELEAQALGMQPLGEATPEQAKEEYERVFSELQGRAIYQSLVAAQSNFEKIVAKVNEEMAAGMEAGAKSRIILPS
jgi:cell fate (sporulation/competence/biofilm development) regulator YlbF (YheA/YmcA/DUF963 family)